MVVSRSLDAINTRSNLNKFQRAHIFGCIPDKGAASEISFRERAADIYAAGVIDACERCGRILCSNVCVYLFLLPIPADETCLCICCYGAFANLMHNSLARFELN